MKISLPMARLVSRAYERAIPFRWQEVPDARLFVAIINRAIIDLSEKDFHEATKASNYFSSGGDACINSLLGVGDGYVLQLLDDLGKYNKGVADGSST